MKESHRCRTCGVEYPRTAEFFHRNKAMPDGLTYYCKKCRCEAVKESTRKWSEPLREWLNGRKAFLGCFVCGEETPHRLVYHHLAPSRKVRDIGTFLYPSVPNMDALMDELNKCVVLCANCHADVHAY